MFSTLHRQDIWSLCLATRRRLVTAALLIGCLLGLVPWTGAQAEGLNKRPGWALHTTQKPYDQLLRDLIVAVKAEGLIVVTQAGPTKAAAARGITLPGNRVIGVFNNDLAVQVLALSTAAMIEAPIRFYVTENSNGSATLSYKLPSHVFMPYIDEGGARLLQIAHALDRRFAAIAEAAQR